MNTLTPRSLFGLACVVAGVVGGVARGLGADHPAALALGVAVAAALALGASLAAGLFARARKERP